MAQNQLSRRSLVLGTMAAAAALGPRGGGASAQAQAAEITEILEPFGGQTVANLAMTALSPSLERETRRSIKLTPVADGSRTVETIMERLNAAPADGSMLGVLALLSSAMGSLYNEKVSLSSLVPIAKLTRGWSEALFAAGSSAIRSWDDFAKAAAGGTLKVATFDRSTVSYLSVLMIKKYANVPVESLVTKSPAETMAAVQNGTAAAGVLPTPSLLSLSGAVHPLLTFGAERNAALPSVPILAELAKDRHAAFTESVAVFAPHGTSPEIARRWMEAFIAAGKTVSAGGEQTTRNIGLGVEGPEILRETMARNTRLLHRMFPS